MGGKTLEQREAEFTIANKNDIITDLYKVADYLSRTWSDGNKECEEAHTLLIKTIKTILP